MFTLTARGFNLPLLNINLTSEVSMDIKLDNHRIRVMRQRLGKASALVKNDRYLPLFRNRQKNHPEEFEQSVEQALSGRVKNPSRWFAKIWAVSKLTETIDIMRTYINRAKSRLAEARHQLMMEAQFEQERALTNPQGLARLANLKVGLIQSFSIT